MMIPVMSVGPVMMMRSLGPGDGRRRMGSAVGGLLGRQVSLSGESQVSHISGVMNDDDILGETKRPGQFTVSKQFSSSW